MDSSLRRRKKGMYLVLPVKLWGWMLSHHTDYSGAAKTIRASTSCFCQTEKVMAIFVFVDKCDNSRYLGLTVSPEVAAPRLSEKQRPESSIIALSKEESASP